MDVKIDTEAMTAVVSRAILEGISTEQRDLLLEQAVTALVTPKKVNSWDRDGVTPLQEAFARAAQATVNRVAYEMVETNEAFVARIREMIGEAIAAAAEEDYNLKEKVVQAVAGAVIDWKRGDR